MHRTTNRQALVLFALAALLLALPALAAERNFSQSYPLAADGRVSLENINGDVTIEGWDGDTVLVEAVIRGSEEAIDRVEIQVDADTDRIAVETDYKNEDRGWSFKGRQNATVDYTVSVPRGARLDGIELVNGDLDIVGVAGNVRAELVNGDLDAHGLSGDVWLETVNGDVEVLLDALGASAKVQVESVNGEVIVALPPGAGAEIRAETIHGDIDNDFGLEVKKDRYVGRSLEASLGGGGARVELETVNGSIRIRSGR